MAFVEEQFPTTISYGSSGGAGYSTDVVVVSSGHEVRNQNWTQARHVYNAALGVQSETQLSALIDFFHAMSGKANSFRYKDWADYKSVAINQEISATDVTIGTGDGTTATFQLIKNYITGLTTQRTITKPTSGSTLLAIDGVVTTGFTISTTTGIITIDNIDGVVGNAVSNGTVTDITDVNHNLQTGDTAYFSTFTGDWASGLNFNRFIITRIGIDNYSVAVDSSAYTPYSANGGISKTLPQSGESVTAGFEFDVPVRFDTDTLSISLDSYATGSTDVPIVEIRI